ncbi:DUF885 domain-containing protein [Antrihabitans sp. YC3-6]|uniref:DUF885 domain-containing protein n=1 Tax=Antrihabitans stalagmiti TaxID=2799499 RepID=A0A934NRC9_9NOCA|nr:DUF885 domain-containing protein [Antrihabitans stalagmiti]MBJ8339895.1 DUF885 domain-containing protein [Antrihabitans stalagmiti]
MTLRSLADEYWEALLKFRPLFATFIGDHRYDDQVDDLSVEGDAEQRETWSKLITAVAAIDPTELDETDLVTRSLLLGELRDNIIAIDERLIELRSDQMQGVHADLLITAGQLQAAEPAHAALAVTRVERLGGMLDQAGERFVAGLAAGRTPARINVDRSLNQIDGYLASPIDDDPFVNISGPADWDGEPEWRADLKVAVEQHLRPAFVRYRAVLAERLLPAARPDEQAGLQWLADGPGMYRALIALHTGLDLTAEDLHEIGRREVFDVLPAQYRELGKRQFGTDDLAEIFRHLLDDEDLRYRDRDEILANATSCLEAAQAAMGDWFGIVPKAPCVLRPIPDYLAADAPAAYYTPPAPDGSRPGEYHVNVGEPTTKGRAETASIAFHEAIPGHHLQLAIAAERDDLPAFRRLSWGHTAYVEGWALYTERLAEEMGLYRNDLDRLGMLASDSWRACRLVVDTGLHAMGWSRQQAIDFMVEHAPVGYDEIVTEIDRYIGMPGQALAYKVGQREILRLRAEAEARLGDQFDIKVFHDAVLGAATVSLPVLADRVGRLRRS